MKINSSTLQLLPAAAAILALYSSASLADYQTEIELLGNHISADGGVSEDTYNAGVTYYLAPVSTEDVPLAEAAFLGKASSVSVAYLETDLESPAGDNGSDGWSISTRQVWGDKYIVSGHYLESETDDDVETERWGVEIGTYLDDYSSISLEVWRTGDYGEEPEHVQFRYHTVSETYEGSLVSGDVYVGVNRSEEANTILQIGGVFDFFLNNRWSIGGGFDLLLPNGDQDDENTYTVRSNYFISENIAIGAEYGVTIFQENDENSSVRNRDAFSVSITGRL